MAKTGTVCKAKRLLIGGDMSQRAYLDHNATAPMRPVARAAMLSELDAPANASSVHAEGRAARARIETAREQVARLVGGVPQAITFTSGATEANALALSPEFEINGKAVRCDVLLVSAVEHPSVKAGGRFAPEQVEIIPVSEKGTVDREALAAMLKKHRAGGRRALVSVMAANNETGALQPLKQIADKVHAAGGVFHSDTVQIVGRVPFGLEASGADLISVSSHKLGGPLGAGAVITRGEDFRVAPLLRGGGQEQGRRAGTENTAAIAGFGAAASQAALDVHNEQRRLEKLRDTAEKGIRKVAEDTVIVADRARRLPNTICFAVPGIAAETAVIAFDLEGVSISAGAACSSGKTGPSETLKAMNLAPELANAAMRLSLGWNSAETDVSRFLEVWKRVYETLSKRAKERAA
jgi:cysteine desulfurase